MKAKRILKYSIVVVIAIFLVGVFVYLAKRSKPEKEQYEEITVAPGTIKRSTVITGKIVPRNEVNIKPQINGIISELYMEAGQEIKENEVIAKLKVIPDMNSLSAAQSRVRLAEINLKQAQTDFDRENKLYSQNLVSADEFEKIRQALEQAKEERSAAQDALEVVRDGVSKTNATSSSTLIRSTITGLILDIPVKVGNSVIQANTMNEGTTVATIANMNDLLFDGKIDETEVDKLSEGMPVIITIGAINDVTFNATLEYIAPKATENNGANEFQIKAAIIPDGSSTIRSGYSANAEIVLNKVDDVLTISESALEFSGDSTFVYLKNTTGEYDRTAVTTGLSDGVNIEVKEGLKEGDVVRGNKIIK